MSLVPYCRIQWLLVLVVSLTSGLIQARSFPGYISHYPPYQYVIKGEDFVTTCVVTLTEEDINVQVSFMMDSAVILHNSSNVTVTSTRHGDQVIGTLLIRNARLTSTQLKCFAFSYWERKFVNVTQTSTIYSSEAPLSITNFPDEELQLDPSSPYTLSCVVTVDDQFPLKAVSVSILYYSISPDVNSMPSFYYHNSEMVDEESRTVTVSIFIEDIERKIGGTYECVAVTKQIENANVADYMEHSRTRISALDTESPENDKNWLTLLLVFSSMSIALLIVFTFLVVAVIWTKRHRSRNYPVSPFPGTIPTAATSGAKSNYYSDSPEISAVNKVALQQPAMALHITPRLQSISSAETDV